MVIRSIGIAAMLGSGIAAAAAYVLPRLVSQDWLAPRLGTATRVAEPEDWPICTTMGSVANGADWSQLDPDFEAGKKALATQDWKAAISVFELAALRDPQNADLQNYIGYAHHRLQQLQPAFAHYRLALTFNPRHRAAHEHLGEAYLAIGKLSEAEAHLAALKEVCLIPCEEYGDLERAIAAHKAAIARRSARA